MHIVANQRFAFYVGGLGDSVLSNAIGPLGGQNEKGLVGNLLWLVESTYPEFQKNSGKKGLAISLWLQYALDNFAKAMRHCCPKFTPITIKDDVDEKLGCENHSLLDGFNGR